jgi:hypothetical protein
VRRTAAQDRYAGGDARHSLSAAYRLPPAAIRRATVFRQARSVKSAEKEPAETTTWVTIQVKGHKIRAPLDSEGVPMRVVVCSAAIQDRPAIPWWPSQRRAASLDAPQAAFSGFARAAALRRS